MKINSAERILEWFDLERYDAYTKGLSYVEWIAALWERCEYWDYDYHAQPKLFPDLWSNKARELAAKAEGEKRIRFDSFISEMKSGVVLKPEWLQARVDECNCYASVHKLEESDIMDLVDIYKIDKEYDEFTSGLRLHIDL
ncbi:TPA: hypothetical protein ACQ98W_002352, partial [Citrobacter braakii]